MLAVALLAWVLPLTAVGGEVQFRLPPRQSFVGSDSAVDIVILDAEKFEQPQLPSVPGLSIVIAPEQNKSTSFSIINGQSRQSVTVMLRVLVKPLREGTFTVPPISVVADGTTFKSEPFTIVALKSESGDLMLVEVVADPPNPYVGQPTQLTLRVLIQPYRDPSMNLVLDGGYMWMQIDQHESTWGSFATRMTQLEQSRRRPSEVEVIRGDRAYLAYEIHEVWTPTRPGPADFSGIEVIAAWPTSVRTARDPLGRTRADIRSTRPLRVKATSDSINVRALPEAGQPASFSGAIGRFAVTASAKPTEVSVGDPITVTFTVKSLSGSAVLETLQPPAFASIPQLAKDFRIPADQVAGTVRDKEKQFTQTFRPLSDEITSIPAIPLSYFDPTTDEYDEAFTAPIPLTVFATERMNLSQIVGSSSTGVDRAAKSLTVVAGGLLANVPPGAALLSRDRLVMNPVTAAAFAAPPLLCGLLALIRGVQRRRDSDPARRRSAKAKAVAFAALGTSPESILTALCGYIADRCGLADGRRTRGDAVSALAERGVQEEIIRRVDGLLSACERGRYAPRGDEQVSAQEAKTLIGLLESAPLANPSTEALP